MATSLTVPISEKEIRALNVGDQVLLSGVIYTGRDAAHKYMLEKFIRGRCPASEAKVYAELKEGLAGGVIYHCGPVVIQRDNGTYQFVAAGPTTSIREEPYEADVIAHFGVRGIIGKGGMSGRTLAACKDSGAVYLHAIGGAATLIAETCIEVLGVFKQEFGTPEAFWKIRVKDFPCVVTMDTHGQSLHDAVLAASQAKLNELLQRT
ncbi:MAG TPA: FumA C-terminus/TtdB family hydratase beta subunit [Phycisphaerae bacterium]|nr:FumA C-terminus/TtdB family hydratase beta subunit [Phycisphaerae bacterium]